MDQLSEAFKKTRTRGQQLRLIDLPVTNENGGGVYDLLEGQDAEENGRVAAAQAETLDSFRVHWQIAHLHFTSQS